MPDSANNRKNVYRINKANPHIKDIFTGLFKNNAYTSEAGSKFQSLADVSSSQNNEGNLTFQDWTEKYHQ